jgi:serine/threonine protein kinase
MAANMNLEPGSRLSHYRIVDRIGKGGMGEVYRAVDSRLPRDVAIKTSVTQFSDRFGREAKVIASLNHPNICTLFDVGPDYLVMEMIEGPTLAERLKSGPLGLDESTGIMRQVADALDYAHEHGVIHRDLKPGNIKIRPDGVVKVLDFGLAKVSVDADPGAPDAVTGTLDQTAVGVVLGTAAYMSPEQVLGKPVDKRADVWAFGVVFYELLTGGRLHKGESTQEIMASVLKDEPDLTRVPYPVRRLLRRCLERDPSKRLRHIGDVMSLLDDAPQGVAQTRPDSSALRKLLWPIVALLALVVAVVTILQTRKPEPSLLQTTITVGPDEGMTFNTGTAPTFSPNGEWIVFQAADANRVTTYWLRSMNGEELLPLKGTETIGANSPPAFFSVDSGSIIFAPGSESTLKKLDIPKGGVAEDLAPWQLTMNGASQNAEGVILAGTSQIGNELFKVVKGSREPIPITVLRNRESNHLWPQFLPDGKHFLYLRVSPDPSQAGIYIGDVDAKPEEQSTVRLIPSDREAYYSPAAGTRVGYLVFMQQDTLMAQPFDPVARELIKGTAAAAIPGIGPVDSYEDRNFGIFSVSNTGALAYRASSGRKRVLAWYDAQGRPAGTLGDPDLYAFPAICKDGRVAVAAGFPASRDIFILDGHSPRKRFTFDAGKDESPAWLNDCKDIAFISDRSGQLDIWVGPADNPEHEQPLLKTVERKGGLISTKDGALLLFTSLNAKTNRDILALPRGNKELVKLVVAKDVQSQPNPSPDGRWLAYGSNEDGTYEIYVRPLMGDANAHGKKVSDGGGCYWPIWKPDSTGLYYFVSQQSRLKIVDIDSSGNPKSSPQQFIPASPLTGTFGWALSLKGDRFLFVEEPGGSHTIPFTVKLNWAAGLKQ